MPLVVFLRGTGFGVHACLVMLTVGRTRSSLTTLQVQVYLSASLEIRIASLKLGWLTFVVFVCIYTS